MILLRINVYEKDAMNLESKDPVKEPEEPKKTSSFFVDLFRTIPHEESKEEIKTPSNVIELHYNIEENSLYYKDNYKTHKTKQDFCRSLEIYVEIIERMIAFNIEYEVTLDNIDDFIKNLIDGRDKFYINDILLGRKGYDLTLLSKNLRRIRGSSDIVKYIIPNIDDGSYAEMLGRI